MTSIEWTGTFNCIDNGRQVELALEEAHRKLWRHHIGWIRPTEWLRYLIEGHETRIFSDQSVKPAGRFFGFQVLKRGNNILTIDRYYELLAGERIRSNLFHAHAARFNMLFRSLSDRIRPIQFVRIPSDDRVGIPGYRLRPPLTCFIILGVSNAMRRTTEASISPEAFD